MNSFDCDPNWQLQTPFSNVVDGRNNDGNKVSNDDTDDDSDGDTDDDTDDDSDEDSDGEGEVFIRC